MEKPLNKTWILDTIFPGGSQSRQFALFLDDLSAEIAQLLRRIGQQRSPKTIEEGLGLSPLVEDLQQAAARLKEAEAYAECLAAQDQTDKKAVVLSGRIKSLIADFEAGQNLFDRLLTQVPDDVWELLLEENVYTQVAYPLNERRELGLEKLPPEQETLINHLAVDGYHGWGELYNTIVGRMKIPFSDIGQQLLLSAGQAANKLNSGERDVRSRVFLQWEKSWSEQADLCADALNRLAGFRLQMYKHRGWDSVHKEPLAMNRMSEQTLMTLWDVIERNKTPLIRYMKRKAKLLGLNALSWHDVDAPLGNLSRSVTYDEAAELIVAQFRKLSPKLAAFTETVFANRWIEAEDRPGKRPGGFCTSFPVSQETRIFMTYAGTASNVSTLAHELGHAYHQHVMNDLPPLAQAYAMNVAETASTFAEMIVSDALVKQTQDKQERLSLLDDKLQRAVAFFMNIHARFLFETDFYEQRRKGLVSVDQLNELMESAQKRAFHDTLSEYHPHFWASKLHFYLTDVPFYNFPYTFGYLFSAGIYAKAVEGGAAFEDNYVAMLRDTGSMMVEDLAKKHLNVDLEKPDFWQRSIDLVVADVNEFLSLTE